MDNGTYRRHTLDPIIERGITFTAKKADSDLELDSNHNEKLNGIVENVEDTAKPKNGKRNL